MNPIDTFLLHSLLIGIVATLVMDGWTLLLKRVFGVPSLDYAMVGRWIGHMRYGRFHHTAIGKAQSIAGERALGWIAHYLIGIAFAAALLLLSGPDWLSRPGPLPALLFGLVTVALPYLVMQPALGMGIAASKSPAPRKARIKSLGTHLVFGVGLYLGGLVNAAMAAIAG
ncbi:DUF2938 domain-containing protein [Pseudomonas sp. SCB32]|uniref:DUF2938 domain-containing protein n=1 Tax=Pseudomonas sp. SCB32 TaxID=2653853 RepID=UPI0012649D5A|nr:DUF2938 domain-containing protein [Pseudomonas sp. SCB32]